MSISLTPEQQALGKQNFSDAVDQAVYGDAATDPSRRDFLKGAVAAGGGLGAAYFGYSKLEGDRVRCAFIGTGDEGNILLTEHPQDYMEIVAIADLREGNRRRAIMGDGNDVRIGLNRKLGEDVASKIEQFKDHRELLENKDRLGIEMVVIAVPLSQHAPIAMECMEAGLHVLTEKLMAHNIKQCKNMIRKAKEKGLLLAVGHQRHYSVLYANANEIVKNGVLGDVKHIRAQWHRNNSFPGSDSWRKSVPKDVAAMDEKYIKEFGYDDAYQLVNWRLYNETGGGLMAELGSHQMDACSIFLGKVHPLAVSGFGGRNFYGVKGVGSLDKQKDDREIDDHIYVTMEFPGPHHPRVIGDSGDDRDLAIVTYSSLNTNRFEPYGETVMGSRGTLIMKTEKEALLYKEAGRFSTGGGADQRIWVVAGSGTGGGPIMEAYETAAGAAGPAKGSGGWGDNISRGYREEMEHFCHCVRTGNFKGPKEGGLRCNGTVAMADAIMALTANRAMALKKRIEFKDEWFDPDSPDTPEHDHPLPGENAEEFLA